jgi:hypothetical protein
MRQYYEDNGCSLLIGRRGWRLIVATTSEWGIWLGGGTRRCIQTFTLFATVLPRDIKKEFEFTGFYSSTKVVQTFLLRERSRLTYLLHTYLSIVSSPFFFLLGGRGQMTTFRTPTDDVLCGWSHAKSTIQWNKIDNQNQSQSQKTWTWIVK